MASGDKFYIADKATLDEVKGKIGSTTDTGGSSTAGSIFGKLNYLVSQVSSYLSSVYNNCLKIGSTTDTGGAASAGTIMAKLNEVILKNGKLLDKNGGYLTAISTLENIIMPEISRSNAQANSTGYLLMDDTYFYYYDTINFKIIKLNKATYVKVAESSAQSGGTYNLVMDDTHIYCVNNSTNKILKFLKSDLSKVLESSGTYTLMSSALDVDNTGIYLYEYSLKKIIKLEKSTLEKVGESAIVTTDTTYGGASLKLYGDLIYLPYTYSSSAYYRIFVYNKNSLLKIQEKSRGLVTFCIDNDYIYNSDTSAKVIKIDRVTLDTVSEFSLVSSNLSGVVIDQNYVYVNNNSTKQVLRLNKDTMTLSAMTEKTNGAGTILSDGTILYKADPTDKVIIKYDIGNILTKYQINGYTKE